MQRSKLVTVGVVVIAAGLFALAVASEGTLSPSASPPAPAPASPTPAPAASTEPDAPVAVAPVGDTPSGRFVESFDGAPGAPEPWNPSTWDVAVHSRDVDTWYELEPMAAHHGPQCQSPTDPEHSTHETSAYADAVFLCRDHVMTALNSSGYGAIYLTPNQLVDFSEGEAVVEVDVSTFMSSHRDWWDIWITPYADNLQAPLEAWFPDLAGAPRNAINIRMNVRDGEPVFTGKVWRDHVESDLEASSRTPYSEVLTPDKSRRDRFQLQVSRTRIRFGMPDHGLWWIDADIADLGWAEGVVQFGHHSYNPAKEGAMGPNTWHWDDVEIDPARPFTMLHGDRRYVDAESPSAVRFDGPAPSHAHLRFSGMGESFEVSFDGGATWETAQRPSQTTSNGLLFSNYWTPVPEGVTEVHVRGEQGWVPAWIAKDFAMWSDGGTTTAPTGSPPTGSPPAEDAPAEDAPVPTATEPVVVDAAPRVLALALVDTATDTEVQRLSLGDTARIGVGDGRTLQAEVSEGVARVEFATDAGSVQDERLAPFAIAGDDDGELTPWEVEPGSYRVRVTPFSADGARGTSFVCTVEVSS